MFIDKYLNETYLDLFYSKYDSKYLSLFNEEEFKEVYDLLISKGFYFIEDIILNYFEIFAREAISVELACREIEEELGCDYVKLIGQDMTIMEKLINKAIDIESEM